ncbi:unnamed protein product [Paramecium octaurelia]|uniref:Uncharacterized protein n=1 Tax=Paramecium octaurelia TaxID=43137 RepID=A0A8S1VXL9_PAROT|nr:unnamed protein product [Paramecium octaurelia]
MIQRNNQQVQECQNSVGQKTIRLKKFMPLTDDKVKISENGNLFTADNYCSIKSEQKIVAEEIMDVKIKILSFDPFGTISISVGNQQKNFTDYFSFYGCQYQVLPTISYGIGTILQVQINMKQKIITCNNGQQKISKDIFGTHSHTTSSNKGIQNISWFPQDLIQNPLNEWYLIIVLGKCTIQILDE